VSHLQAAATLALDRPRRIAILDELAWQANLGGDFGAGVPALRELEELMADSPDIAARVRVHLRLASLLSAGSGDLRQAARAADQAERLAAQAGDLVLQVKALNERSWIVGIGGDIRAQVKLAAEALDKARRLGDSEVQLHVLGSLGHSAAAAGQFELAERSLAEGLVIARSLGDQGQIAWHGGQVAWVKAFQGQVEAAIRLDEEIGREIPDLHQAQLFEFQGFVKWLAGRWEEAAADSQRMAGSWSAAGMTMREVWALATAVACLAEMGRLPEATTLAGRIRRRVGHGHFIWMSDWFGYACGVLELATGRTEAARDLFAEAARRLEGMGADAIAPFPLLELVEVAVASHDLDLASAGAGRLEELARSLAPPWFAGLAAIAGGQSALARGLAREAERLADEAVSRLEDSPFEFYAARALELRGRLRSGSADTAGAIQDLTGALARYRRLPSPQRVEGVLLRLDGLGSVGRRTAAGLRGASALSPRERSVAVLAAQGLTAREIAEKLFISERTVESHLASAYAKLGLASKRELMRRARDLQLGGRT
ncbi:MAG TPA: LuxR C-terminal-related transcriptional regulator, partial [Candidatus Acidoferrales bacterium]|nr:LuxR C-terminal-related transcriptional regulator [Candidatus Acidoferrales bacterium]